MKLLRLLDYHVLQVSSSQLKVVIHWFLGSYEAELVIPEWLDNCFEKLCLRIFKFFCVNEY